MYTSNVAFWQPRVTPTHNGRIQCGIPNQICVHRQNTSYINHRNNHRRILWYDATVITSITCGSATVTPNTVTDSSANTIQGIEIKQLMTAGGVWGTNANITFVKAGDDIVMPVEFCV
jgi:hypothetical protein